MPIVPTNVRFRLLIEEPDSVVMQKVMAREVMRAINRWLYGG